MVLLDPWAPSQISSNCSVCVHVQAGALIPTLYLAHLKKEGTQGWLAVLQEVIT